VRCNGDVRTETDITTIIGGWSQPLADNFTADRAVYCMNHTVNGQALLPEAHHDWMGGHSRPRPEGRRIERLDRRHALGRRARQLRRVELPVRRRGGRSADLPPLHGGELRRERQRGFRLRAAARSRSAIAGPMSASRRARTRRPSSCAARRRPRSCGRATPGRSPARSSSTPAAAAASPIRPPTSPRGARRPASPTRSRSSTGASATAARGIFDPAPVMLATGSAVDSSPLSQNAFLRSRLSRKKQDLV
jgi:hypothetical protein